MVICYFFSNLELLNFQEFNDTLSYIASLRDISEPHGICCVVPPPSWDPPCLLGERQIWEGSRFFTQVQIFDGVHTDDPKIKKETDADSDDDDTFHKVKFCKTELGNEYTLEIFKNFADSYLESHFRLKEKVKDAWPTVADVEKEFRKLLENPFVELGVMLKNQVYFFYIYMKLAMVLTRGVKLGALWE